MPEILAAMSAEPSLRPCKWPELLSKPSMLAIFCAGDAIVGRVVIDLVGEAVWTGGERDVCKPPNRSGHVDEDEYATPRGKAHHAWSFVMDLRQPPEDAPPPGASDGQESELQEVECRCCVT